MDHPLGQVFAAYEAASAWGKFPEIVDVCGLVTHGLFEHDTENREFFDALGLVQPQLQPPAGTGLGFDELLDSLRWEKLT